MINDVAAFMFGYQGMLISGTMQTISLFQRPDIEFSGAVLVNMCIVVQASRCATFVVQAK